MRRSRFCLVVSSLRRREALERGLMSSLPLVGRILEAEGGRFAPEVAVADVPSRRVCESGVDSAVLLRFGEGSVGSLAHGVCPRPVGLEWQWEGEREAAMYSPWESVPRQRCCNIRTGPCVPPEGGEYPGIGSCCPTGSEGCRVSAIRGGHCVVPSCGPV